MSAPELYVVFRVGDGEYVAPASAVQQMETYSGATKVPGTPPFVAGIVQVRGRVLPVIDLRTRFGLPADDQRGLDARLVVVSVGERVVALLADRAREVVRLDPDSFRAAPEAATSGGFVTSVAQANGRLVMRLDLTKVAGEGIEAAPTT